MEAFAGGCDLDELYFAGDELTSLENETSFEAGDYIIVLVFIDDFTGVFGLPAEAEAEAAGSFLFESTLDSIKDKTSLSGLYSSMSCFN